MKSFQRVARHSTQEIFVASLRALAWDYLIPLGPPWLWEIFRGKEGRGRIFSPPCWKATRERPHRRGCWNSECPLRWEDSASPWDIITWTQNDSAELHFYAQIGVSFTSEKPSGISPMWIIHHIFKESQSLISQHTLHISNPGEACYTYNPMFSYFKQENFILSNEQCVITAPHPPPNSHDSALHIGGHYDSTRPC